MKQIYIERYIVVPDGNYCSEKNCNFHARYSEYHICTIFGNTVLREPHGKIRKCQKCLDSKGETIEKYDTKRSKNSNS